MAIFTKENSLKESGMAGGKFSFRMPLLNREFGYRTPSSDYKGKVIQSYQKYHRIYLIKHIKLVMIIELIFIKLICSNIQETIDSC